MRISEKGTPRATPSLNQEGFCHSLDIRNPYLINCWAKVKDGLLAASTRLKFHQCFPDSILSPEDLNWLEKHKGLCARYIHPDCNYFKRLYAKHAIEGENRNDFIDRYFESQPYLVGISPRFPNLKPETQDTYETALRKFWNFLALLGSDEAYEAMLILLLKSPESMPYPSVPVRFLIAFVQQQFDYLGRPLIVNGIQYNDCFGREILCACEVNCPESFNTFWSAMKTIHLNRRQEGCYSEKCNECYELYKACDNIHSFHPCRVNCQARAYTCGQPVSTERKRCFVKNLKASPKALSYQAKPRAYLLPSELYTFQEHLMRGQFEIKNLMHYTMTILSVTQAGLRFQGTQNKTFHSFQAAKKHWQVRNGKIVRLAHYVQEKYDQKPHLYVLQFTSPDCPKICVLRHLLIFIHCSNHRNGILFPENPEPYDRDTFIEEEVINAESYDWESDITAADDPIVHSSYRSFYNYIRDRIRYDCPYTDNMNIGIHILRRSYYLFSWYCILLHKCKVSLPEIQRNARHETDEMAIKYSTDSTIVANEMVADPTNFSQFPVPRFQDNLLSGDGQTLQRVACYQNDQQVILESVSDAAKFFVSKMLGVSSNDNNYRNPKFLLERSYSMHFSHKGEDENPISSFYQYIDENLPENQKDEVRERFVSALVFNNRLHHANLLNAVNSSPSSLRNVEPNEALPISTETTAVIVDHENPDESLGTASIHPHLYRCHDSRLCAMIPALNAPPLPHSSQIPHHNFQCLVPYQKDPHSLKVKVNLKALIKQSKCSTSASLAMYRLVLEVSSCSSNVLIGETTNDVTLSHRLQEGKRKCRPSRHLFSRNEIICPFITCLSQCHHNDIYSFMATNPTYKAHTYHCSNCTEI